MWYNVYRWFPNARCADAADANQDGYISTIDSTEILNYYACYLSGVTYTGTVGRTKYFIS